MTVERVLTDEVRRRITDAVRVAEAGSSGEIVVVVVNESDGYERRRGEGGDRHGGRARLDLLYRHATPLWWRLPVDAGLLAAVLVGACAFVLVARSPSLRRGLAGRRRRRDRVRAAAHTAFRGHGVAATGGAAGYSSSSVSRNARSWYCPTPGSRRARPRAPGRSSLGRFVAEMNAGRPAEALVDAVRACGEVLHAAGYAAAPGDRNELRDEPR